MSETINNKKILVTRPRHQASQLCELISNGGGHTILFPTIEVRPIINSDVILNRFRNLDVYDYIIFVSRNAVKVTFENYLNLKNITDKQQVLAIGSGTASVLHEIKITNILHAGIQADSESLLLIPELAQELICNKKILIVRGVGGRELLADSLKKRGAQVDYAEVYERCLPEYGIQECHEIWQNENPDAVVVSSNEGLVNLVKLTVEADRKQLFNTPLVVMSDRNADLAKETGFVSEIKVAVEKSDNGLFSTLQEIVGVE
ncbi:MAG: uroporphyrinogen-III synthase [Pseudomonadota bacterium]